MCRNDTPAVPDLAAMQSLAQRVWSPASRWHIGDLAWASRTWRPGVPQNERVKLWHDAGEVIAWGWLQELSHLDLLVDPDRPQVTQDVLAWFDEVAGGPARTCTVSAGETHLVEALLAEGYRPDPKASFFLHHTISLDDLPTVELPAGFTLERVTKDDAERRAASHRLAWSDLGPSQVTTEAYAALMAAWPYRPELDWVVRAPDGAWVANSLGWIDVENAVGLLEPVGTAPAHRRLGLSRAVNLAVLHTLRDSGATTALVCPRGDDGYPVPGKLYRSLGFAPGFRTVTYVR